MRRLVLACCYLVACQQQPHHRPADPQLQTELAATISSLLREMPGAPAAGDWVDEQAAMLALSAQHDLARVEAIRRGSIAPEAVREQSLRFSSLFLRRFPEAKPPLILSHLEKVADLDSREATLLYCLIIQATNESGMTTGSKSLTTE